MIDRRTVFEIHRLNNLGYSKRKIARELGLDRETVRKYIEHPERVVLPKLCRTSKLDPYRDLIDQFLESDPYVKAPVVIRWPKMEVRNDKNKNTFSKSSTQDNRQLCIY